MTSIHPESLRVLTDRALLDGYAMRGDARAFAVLVHRHGPMVQRVCRDVLSDPHDADDVFQSTFLVLAGKASSMPWQDSVAGWLQEVAWRLAHKARTAGARRRHHEGRAALPRERPGAFSPLDEVSLRESVRLLDEELARLPTCYRGPLVQCYLEGATQEEAARFAGWSLSTLKRRLRRGLELLESRLIRRGLSSPPVGPLALLPVP
jgi:RNA polymerase sigma factor (sigma-70 family)